MINVYNHLLYQKNKKLFLEFEIIEQLFIFVSSNNKIKIPTNYFQEILKSYLFGGYYSSTNKNNLDSLYNFFIEVLKIYQEKKISKFNFILKSSNLSKDLTEWFLKNKEDVLSIYQYYLENQENDQVKIIFLNDFVKIIRLKKSNLSLKNNIALQFPQGIVFRIPLVGHIIYNDKLFLSEGEFLLTSSTSKLNHFKVISSDLDLIIVHLNDKFFDEFSINISNVSLKKGTHFFSEEHFNLLLATPYIEYNHFIILEVVTELFLLANLLPTSTASYFTAFKNIPYQLFIQKIIVDNLTLSEEDITCILMDTLNLNFKTLEKEIYLNFKMTLTKLIIKLKINIITSRIFSQKESLVSLIQLYNLNNKNIFKYNFKNVYKLDFNKIEKS